MKSIHLILALFLSSVLIAQTPDAFTKIKMKEVPKSVKQSFMQMFPKADQVEWATFSDEFQAKHKLNNHTVFSRYNSEGLHLNDLTQLNWEKEADEKLKNSKKRSFYKHWEVIEFYRKESSEGDVSYTLQLKNEDNELGTIYFDGNGNLEEKSKSSAY